jgi:hypothetical protein
MTGDESWDDDDDGFDFDLTGDGSTASALNALDDYAPAAEDSGDDDWGSADPLASVGKPDQAMAVLFTVANPAGTVSATATIGGRLQRIGLTASVAEMTEAQLAEEITVLAGLAGLKAQAAEHAVVVELMRTMGHDRVLTGGFLQHTLGLPSPEAVDSRVTQVFASRYAVQGD